MPGGQPPALLRPGARGQRGRAAREPARVLRGGVGCAPLGAPRHADQLAPLGRGGRLHRRRLRRHGPRGLRGLRRGGGPARRRRCARRPAGGRRPAAGLRLLRGGGRRPAAVAPAGGVRGELDVLLVGHHRAAQGHQAAAGGRPPRRVDGVRAAGAGAVRGRRGQRLPQPGAALPRRPGRVDQRDPPPRRHGRGHGALRPGPGARADRAAPRHPRAVRADPPRAADEAAGGGAGTVRPVEPRRWWCTPPHPARPR